MPFSAKGRKQVISRDLSKTVSTSQLCVSTHTGNNHRFIRGSSLVWRPTEAILPGSKSRQSLEEDIGYVLQHYTPVESSNPAEFNPFHNQICGAWVEALPQVVMDEERNAFLFFAIKTLAASLQSLSPTGLSYKPHLLTMYCKSLGLMNEALERAQGVFRIEHCVAIMCLAVSDVGDFPLLNLIVVCLRVVQRSWFRTWGAGGQFI